MKSRRYAMKNYILCTLVTILGFSMPASLYAQPVADAAPVVTESEPPAPTPAPVPAETAPVEADAEKPEAVTPAEKVAKDPLGTAGEIKEAVQSGNWGLAVLLILMLIVGFLRWGAGKIGFLSFFKSTLGGYILVFTSSSGGMLLTVLGAGGSLTFATISEAVVFGFGAIGGWEAWKDIKKKKASAEPVTPPA
jgi:hypothetical protein